MSNSKKSKKEIPVFEYELRGLLWWACVGINKSRGGYCSDEIESIIESYAEELKFTLPDLPLFGRRLKRARTTPAAKGEGK